MTSLVPIVRNAGDARITGWEMRADLPPITRLWTAWRAAITSHR